ncbi:Nucleosome assembly protein 1-like 4 [Saguinus oedipus]|uniref:Nucleosome assembly protein 1-like 4 n=1 Tax=Saguinus oedipus TaxID=9490 RepID=A0ABQ9W9G2_SAGOE|nr:Nucleosome assembly protein 1-like 4 [Saguinus oedipus]
MADNSFSDGVPSDSVEAAKNANDTEKLPDQVMQNPRVLAALQERLDNVPHTPSSYIETLPKAVKRRINALKQLQMRCTHIEAKFYEEVHDLERKYAAFYQPLFDKRRKFITGDVEPTDVESEWHSENEEEKLAGDVKNKVVITEKAAATAEEPNPKGIPEFWFTIFRNVDMLSELVQEYDDPILKHLQDINVKFSDPGQPMSFVLEFHFEPKDCFTNSVLTKTYKMKSEPDKADPFSVKGPEIVDCDGYTIDWKKGKNVTVKTIKKKQKHKGRGTVRTITKQVPNESFFNFFNPLKASGDGESLDEDSEFTSASDFEIEHFFHERIVPLAVLYFTGEAIEDDDNFEEGEEEESEGEEEGEDEDDPEINPKKEPSQPANANSRVGQGCGTPAQATAAASHLTFIDPFLPVKTVAFRCHSSSPFLNHLGDLGRKMCHFLAGVRIVRKKHWSLPPGLKTRARPCDAGAALLPEPAFGGRLRRGAGLGSPVFRLSI